MKNSSQDWTPVLQEFGKLKVTNSQIYSPIFVLNSSTAKIN